MKKSTVKFRCKYELDERVDSDLASLTQSMYREIQSALSPQYKVHCNPDGTPDPVQYYLLYTAALIYGAADAALTLILHNLGREARLLERQVFECWIRSLYYADNPDVARLAYFSTPFQELRILERVNYDKNKPRYLEVSKLCDEVAANIPGSRNFREPALADILAIQKDSKLMGFYTIYYRIPSQMAHATLAGVGGVWDLDGLSFDSRLDDPNVSLEMLCSFLLAFLKLINDRLEVELTKIIDELTSRHRNIQKRLQYSDGTEEPEKH